MADGEKNSGINNNARNQRGKRAVRLNLWNFRKWRNLIARRAALLWREPVSRSVIIILILLILTAALGAYRDGTGFDVMRRLIQYGGKSNKAPLFSYEQSSNTRYMALGDSLVILSDTSLRLLDQDGNILYAGETRMKNPALSGGGKRVAAYDIGGVELYVLDDSGVILNLTADANEPFLSARLNRNGWLTVTAGKRGYQGAAMVYNHDLKLIYEYDASSRPLADAIVTDDNNYLAALTLGQSDGDFTSDINLYRIGVEQEVPQAEYEYQIPDALALELNLKNQYLTVPGDTCLAWTRPGDDDIMIYDYQGAYLREYNLNGDGFAVLLLNRYQSGNLGRVVSVNRAGEEIGSLDVREEILGLSAAGRYIAVLYADRLEIYNQFMRLYATLPDADSLRGMIMRSDGSVLLLSASSARLFLP